MVINELLEASYIKGKPVPTQSSYYTRLMENGDFRRNAAQFYHLLKEQNKLDQTPTFFREFLISSYTQSLFTNIFIKNQTDNLLETMEKHEIDVIPLKGVKFAQRYFGNLGARPTSDIDLLIKRQDLSKVIECVKTNGFTVEEEYLPLHFHRSFSKLIPDSSIPLTVEIHWNVLYENTSTLNPLIFWDHAKRDSGKMHNWELSAYHTFYIACIHGWRHNMDSIKYYLDIIQMLTNPKVEIDYKNLIHDSDLHKTRKRMIRTLSRVYHEFPFISSIKPFPYRKNSIRDIKGIRKYIDFIDYQFMSYDTTQHRLIEMFNWTKQLMKAYKPK